MEAATATPPSAEQTTKDVAAPAKQPEPKREGRTQTQYVVLVPATGDRLAVILGDFAGYNQAEAKKAAAQQILDGGEPDATSAEKDKSLYGKLTSSGLEFVAVPKASWRPERIKVERPPARLVVN